MARPGRGRITGPLFLIGVGAFFLLYNLGVFDRSVRSFAIQFWPLILIAAGVEIILRRRFPWTSLLVGLVAVVGMGFFSFGEIFLGLPQEVREEGPSPVVVTERLAGAREARIEIEAGTAALHLDGTAASSFLVTGTIVPVPGETVVRSFNPGNGRAVLRLKTKRKSGFRPFGLREGDGRWELHLTRQVPLALVVRTGVGTAVLDLKEIRATEIEVRTAVGRTRLILPRTGTPQILLAGGVGETEVRVPPGMAVRVKARQGLGEVDLEGDWVHKDGEYFSRDYPTARHRATVKIEGGIGRIVVRQE